MLRSLTTLALVLRCGWVVKLLSTTSTAQQPDMNAYSSGKMNLPVVLPCYLHHSFTFHLKKFPHTAREATAKTDITTQTEHLSVLSVNRLGTLRIFFCFNIFMLYFWINDERGCFGPTRAILLHVLPQPPKLNQFLTGSLHHFFAF